MSLEVLQVSRSKTTTRTNAVVYVSFVKCFTGTVWTYSYLMPREYSHTVLAPILSSSKISQESLVYWVTSELANCTCKAHQRHAVSHKAAQRKLEQNSNLHHAIVDNGFPAYMELLIHWCRIHTQSKDWVE